MGTATAPRVVTGHIGLNVSDLERSIAFYRQAFGFDELAVSADGAQRFAFLGFDSGPVLTLWEQSSGEFSAATPGLHHLSFQVDSVQQVQQVEAILKQLSTVFVHDGVVAHREGAASGGIFFTDPDGIRLEVFAASGAEQHQAPVGDAPTCGFF
ncbi:VOC family protein [Mycobacteroides abscessus]|uniref:Glyoxalase/Bleomycin resistance /Dioxygenase superfamily protein n=3 Tax=Mycobacteroides abscessus TaxID=36809 RepID=X8DQE7_9MYCO|nr:VOC family protein [Mycobacteroides abscessus]EUA69898.1 glyoxalase/Bleomycin resistance /Dioxygenase superfamily protein [Mycobacteroides abscessus subsp. bolletii 1513]AGM29597.1 putative lactoylglutathione lyase [Mycobacteroides abscessus subsp. bolletii 50594]AMU31687.1 glyoxalase [Mycobacteroides abscessus]AMU66469.1 glyoxalase [Mycobacteroides abscessus]AMU76141.1 glyoxalase [Mycobacteroides abscessus]